MSPPSRSSPLIYDEKAPTLEQKPSLSQFLVREESGQRLVTKLSTSSLADYTPTEGLGIDTSAYQGAQNGHDADQTRSPIQDSTSPSPKTTDLATMDYEKYYEQLYKPKVKLGPRPVTVSEKNKRLSQESSRPVSSLPPGLHSRSKSTKSPHLPPQTQLPPLPISASPPQISMTTLGFSHSPPPIPDDGLYSSRPSSRGSSRSLPVSTRTATSTKTSKTAITPEKLRMMKAMELRKKQMRKSSPPLPATTFASLSEKIADANQAPAESKERNESLIIESTESDAAAADKADSGIGMGYEAPARFIMVGDDNLSVSRPQSSNTPRESGQRNHAQLTLVASNMDRLAPKLLDQESNDSPTLGRAPERLTSHKQSIDSHDESTTSSLQVTPEVLQTEGFSAGPIPSNGGKTPEILIPESDQEELEQTGLQQKDPALQKKRRGLVEPLTIDIMPSPPIPTPMSEQNYLSDEEFYEELQSATFQEAKPIIMSRSPASPFFPRRPSARSAQSAQSIMTIASGASLMSIPITKTFTNPVERIASPSRHLSPDAPIDPQGRTLSVSSARTVESERGDPMAAATQRKVSSGISKRIAALAEKSAREGSPPGTSTPQALSENSSLVSMRKASIRDIPSSRPTSTNTEPRPTSKLSMWPGPEPVATRRESSSNKDSISVTARIVRPSPDQNEASPVPGELHQSPILINHTRSAPKPDFPAMDTVLTGNAAPVSSKASSEPVERPQSASYSIRSDESNATSMRKSFSRYRGHESPRKSKTASTASIASDGKDSREDSEKSSSRTSRFFKRISTLGNKRKSVVASPPVTSPVMSPDDEPMPAAAPSTLSPTPLAPSRSIPSLMQAMKSGKSESISPNADVPPPVVIGDINVQFPDNLVSTRFRPVSETITNNLLPALETPLERN